MLSKIIQTMSCTLKLISPGQKTDGVDNGHITIYSNFNESIDFYNLLVKDCTRLTFEDLPDDCGGFAENHYSDVLKQFPTIKTLQHLTICCFYGKVFVLCKRLLYLSIGFNFSPKIIISKYITNLYLRSYHYKHNTKLNKYVVRIVFNEKFNYMVHLSKNIVHLEFGYNFSQPVVLPKNIKLLLLNVSLFNHPLLLPKPERMWGLFLGSAYSQRLDCEGLKSLNIISNNHLIIDNIPNGMTDFFANSQNDVKMNNVPNDLEKSSYITSKKANLYIKIV